MRTSAKGSIARKKKRHGKLTRADQDLVREAETGTPAMISKQRKATTPVKILKRDAIELMLRVAEKIDWKQAVAVQSELQQTCRKMGTDHGNVNVAVQLSADDLQLQRYWSGLLVKSVLELNIK